MPNNFLINKKPSLFGSPNKKNNYTDQFKKTALGYTPTAAAGAAFDNNQNSLILPGSDLEANPIPEPTTTTTSTTTSTTTIAPTTTTSTTTSTTTIAPTTTTSTTTSTTTIAPTTTTSTTTSTTTGDGYYYGLAEQQECGTCNWLGNYLPVKSLSPLPAYGYSPFLKGVDGKVYSGFQTGTYNVNAVELINVQYPSCAAVPCDTTTTSTTTSTTTAAPTTTTSTTTTTTTIEPTFLTTESGDTLTTDTGLELIIG